MKTIELKVARIGNSRGVRLPAESLRRYRISGSVIMEERSDGILLRPVNIGAAKLSWEETAREMANDDEDWTDWDSMSDGLDAIPWERPTRKRTAKQRAVQRRSRKGRTA